MDGKQIKPGTIASDKTNFSAPVAPGDPVIKSALDSAVSTLNASINAAVQNRDAKDSVRVATKVNVNLSSPGATIDGVALNIGESFLPLNQANTTQNGPYVFNGPAVAATRRSDADSSAKVTSQMVIPVEEGTNANTAWKLVTPNPIVLGTTNLSFQLAAVFTAPVLSTNNKFMTGSTTVNDGDLACATPLSSSPTAGAIVMVYLNGELLAHGDGVKTAYCYFSADNGATAKAWANIAAGDKLYWVGSVAGYQINNTTDKFSFVYTS